MSLDYSISGARVLEQDAHSADGPQIELSVVMPCLNERETVGVCVRKAIASLRDAGIRSEVIVAEMARRMVRSRSRKPKGQRGKHR